MNPSQKMARNSIAAARDKEGGRNARPLGVCMRLLAAALAIILLSLAFYEAGVPVLIDQLPSAQPIEQETAQEPDIDWDALPEEIVAWVKVPGTSIDEPVAQASPGDPNFYLYADAMCQGAYGTPYIDSECSTESRYIAVYGHHMNDGSVFADLANYTDPSFAKEHQVIQWYTRADQKCYELKVVAVDVVNANRETQHTSFINDYDRTTYLQEKLRSSDVVLDEPNLDQSNIISFTTCSYQTHMTDDLSRGK